VVAISYTSRPTRSGLLLLYAVDPQRYSRFCQAAETIANQVWDNTKIHNKQQHLVTVE
jgi:hypothetical protein